VRQAAQKRIQYRKEPAAAGQAGRADGFADLLLVVPFLGVFARDVEPVFGLRFARPGNAKERRAVRVERGRTVSPT
jgi:hypothetical protein